ncbi:MAG TPA: hypothetical protein VF173_16275 [Thermoanaerobaculia bacterium]|nr:hypothetical protein [Thermoanaerobaculia bacterium]
MSFSANLTMTGLCILVTDNPTTPTSAELLVLDTSDMNGDHRHYPYMSFLYDSRGNLGHTDQPALPGWEEYVIGPDGRAITRILLENTIVRIRATTEAGTALVFVRDASMAKVPDLSLLGVTALTQPGQDGRIDKITSRIALPAGTLFTTGDVTDDQGPIQWKGVGVIAELVHIQLQGLSELTVDHGGNSFSLQPVDGVVALSISNEPTTVPLPLVDTQRHLVLVPHFDMFERVADHRPELARDGEVTPGNPACPTASWVQANWSFLT